MDIRDSVIKFKKYAHNFDFANKDNTFILLELNHFQNKLLKSYI